VRADNGYRVFDESALDELSFISRAKGIGMQLDEISELRHAWATGECRMLQARLRLFLADRIAHTRSQQDELAAFERQLASVLSRLDAREPGPEQCGQGCECEFDLDSPSDATISARTLGCTLDPDELGARVAQWRAVARSAHVVESRRDLVRLQFPFPFEPDLMIRLCALCAAEARCCSEASFVVTFRGGELMLTVAGDGVDRLAVDLFGTQVMVASEVVWTP